MRTAAEMREVIEAWEGSELTQREFAEQEGLSYTAFQYWRRRLKELDEPSDPEVVPLRIVDDQRPAQATGRSSSPAGSTARTCVGWSRRYADAEPASVGPDLHRARRDGHAEVLRHAGGAGLQRD